MRMTMQVASLRIDMAKCDRAPDRDVRVGIGHRVSTQRMLELGAHESVTFAGIFEDEEMDLEHEHVEERWDDDEAYGPREEVLGPEFGANARIAQ